MANRRGGGASFTVVPHGYPDSSGRVEVTLYYRGADGYTNSYSGYCGGPKGGPVAGLFSGGSRGVGGYVRMPNLSAQAGRDLYGFHIGGNYLIHGDIGSKGCIAIENFGELVQDVREHGKPSRLQFSKGSPSGYGHSSGRGQGGGLFDFFSSSGVSYDPEPGEGRSQRRGGSHTPSRGISDWLNNDGPEDFSRQRSRSGRDRDDDNDNEPARRRTGNRHGAGQGHRRSGESDNWFGWGESQEENRQQRRARKAKHDDDDERPRARRTKIRYDGEADSVSSPRAHRSESKSPFDRGGVFGDR